MGGEATADFERLPIKPASGDNDLPFPATAPALVALAALSAGVGDG